MMFGFGLGDAYKIVSKLFVIYDRRPNRFLIIALIVF